MNLEKKLVGVVNPVLSKNQKRRLRKQVNGMGIPMVTMPRLRNDRLVAANITQQMSNRSNQMVAQGIREVNPGMGLVKANLGSTTDGQNWAMCALDPCGCVNEVAGLPDTICASTAVPGYRAESNIGWDTSMFSSAPTAPTTYTIQLIVPPIPEISFMYRLRNDADGTWSNTRVVRLPGFALATTADQNGTTLRSIGYSKYRFIGKGTTIELNAADIANQGRIISGQLESSVSTFESGSNVGPLSATVLDLRSGGNYQRTQMNFPNSSQYLVSSCPKSYQAEAKQGAYVVSRFCDPLKGYQFHRSGGFTAETSSAPLGGSSQSIPASYLTIEYSDTPEGSEDISLASFTTDSRWNTTAGTLPTTGDNSSGMHPYISQPSGILTSVTFIEGLVVGSSITGATIRVKTREYLECISGGSAAIAPFVKASPMYDDVAITSVVKVSQLGMDAYPASYNGMGDILGSIWSAIKTFGKPLLSAAEYIPGFGTGAKWINSGIDLADTLIPSGFAS